MADLSATIPGNDHALSKLRKLLGSSEAIAFVGAGASAGLYPLWNGMIHKLADEAVSRGKAVDETRRFWLETSEKRPQQAIRAIKEALGEGTYAQALRETFSSKAGVDGKKYTPIHGLLLRMRFRGYVTTNYDPGLLEARFELRPDIGPTGYATWKDAEVVYRWQTGEIFNEQPCPILFSHGIYEKSDSIVLGVSEYREAYRPGPYRRLFDKLWGECQLVFVGFGFSDPWLDFLADEVVTLTAARAVAEPRHIAIIGLREGQTYSPDRRKLFEDQYNASAIFYRIADTPDGLGDHNNLQRILEGLAGALMPPTLSPLTTPTISPSQRRPQRWTHETTNDDRYVENPDVLRHLNRLADDHEVRVIAVTGLGGLGKTALIGHWLKDAGGDVRRANRGLFFWSFYADRDVNSFLEALLEFAAEELRVVLPKGERLVERAVALIKQVPLLVVLDGLEMLQERPGEDNYGTLRDGGASDVSSLGNLHRFLDAACRARHSSLIVLTSRFLFADLNRHSGIGLRNLPLDRLTSQAGAELLARCDVGGTAAEREDVSHRLEGHPLGLRVFAAALASQSDSAPTRFYQKVFEQSGLREDEPLERKLRHLLSFYEQQLPPERTALLGIISLFPTSVDKATIKILSRGLPVANQTLGHLTDDELRRELQRLCYDRLVLSDHLYGEDAYSCHPVLRDHFRKALLSRDDTAASVAADLLAERPSAEQFTNLREIEPILTAIELFLETGNFSRADELYHSRLESGRIFLHLPAFHEGIKCSLGFVATPERRQQCENQLSRGQFGYYLTAVAVFAINAGDFGLAEQFCDYGVVLRRESGDKKNLSIDLQNYTEILTHLGRLADAESKAREVLSLAREIEDKEETMFSLSSLGDVLTYQGRVTEAMLNFEEANMIQMQMSDDSKELISLRGIRWANLMLHLNQTARARELTEANLQACDNNRWFDDIARCHWILGRADTTEGQFQAAAEHLATAESIMRRGNQLEDLPKLLLARAELERCRKAWDEALRYVDDVIRETSLRGMNLSHADALVLRGRLLFERTQAETVADATKKKPLVERAQDDANDALILARQCGYAWAERDALALLADAYHALGDAPRALTYRHDADVIAERLRLN